MLQYVEVVGVPPRKALAIWHPALCPDHFGFYSVSHTLAFGNIGLECGDVFLRPPNIKLAPANRHAV